MKKHVIKLDKSFSFDKETITKLSDTQLSSLAGGKGTADQKGIPPGSCAYYSCPTHA